MQWPAGCEKCDDSLRRILGCGFDKRFRDNGTGVPVDAGDDPLSEDRTCPEYYARSPLISSVYRFLGPYKIGALGPIWDVDNLLVELLQIIDAEAKYVESEMSRQLYED